MWAIKRDTDPEFFSISFIYSAMFSTKWLSDVNQTGRQTGPMVSSTTGLLHVDSFSGHTEKTDRYSIQYTRPCMLGFSYIVLLASCHIIIHFNASLNKHKADTAGQYTATGRH